MLTGLTFCFNMYCITKYCMLLGTGGNNWAETVKKELTFFLNVSFPALVSWLFFHFPGVGGVGPALTFSPAADLVQSSTFCRLTHWPSREIKKDQRTLTVPAVQLHLVWLLHHINKGFSFVCICLENEEQSRHSPFLFPFPLDLLHKESNCAAGFQFLFEFHLIC